MFYDHDEMDGSFGNARVYDLTNYPKTLDPSIALPASLHNIDTLERQEIIGLRQDGSQNTIRFTMVLYSQNCPLHGPNETSSLDLDITKAKILYCYELSFRVIDYFFDKFLWAMSDADFYEDVEERKR